MNKENQLRSFLFVPAEARKLEKIKSFQADVFVIDLEDSISEEKKSIALEMVKAFLNNNIDLSNIVVRVNKDNYLKEIYELHSYDIGFMLPKFENIDEYLLAQDQLEEHFVIALIESPIGIVNIQEICKCHYIDAVAFGAEDYTTITNKKNVYQNLEFEKNHILLYAKAYGKYVIDTPCFALNDEQYFIGELEHSKNMGFDGKLAIHPKHIGHINKKFCNSNVEELKRIIDIYEKSGEAIVVIDGKVYEKMHIKQMKEYLEEKQCHLQ